MKKHERKNAHISDKISYYYLKNIKKWMFCPACEISKMSFNKKTSSWVCEDCGYSFTEEYFLNDCVFWFCDECEIYLNNQEGFDQHNLKHICQNCGYENVTTSNSIKGICAECGKLLPNPSLSICSDCREVRHRKIKKWVIEAGKKIGGVALAVGAAYLAAQSHVGDDEKEVSDTGCGNKKYKVIFDSEEQDELFDTEEAAEEYALYLRTCDKYGAEILNISNPGEYDYDEEDYNYPDYEVIEVDNY